MRKLIIGIFFALPIITLLIFINTAYNQGNPGFTISKTQKGLLVSRITDHISPVEENDLIVSSNGLRYPQILGFLILRPDIEPTGTLKILREGKLIDLPLETAPFTFLSLMELIWPRVFLIAVFLALGTVVIYKSPPDHVSLLFFLMLCSFSTSLSATIPSSVGFLSPMTYSFSFLLHAPFNWIAFGLWLHFALRFPEERDVIKERWWIPALIYLIPAVTTIGGSLWASGMGEEFFGWVQRLRNLYLPFIIIAVFVKHATDYKKIKTQQERNRIKLPLIAYWLTFAPYLLFYLLPNLVIDTPLISFRMAVFAFFILPLAYYAGILRYKLFKVDQIISRTIAYFAIIIALSIIYSVFLAILKRWFFGDAVLSKELFLIFLILMNIIFHPLIMRLDRLIRRLFFKDDAISIKTMHSLSEQISSTLELPRMIHLVTRDLPREIRIRTVALMTLEEDRSRLYPENFRFGTSLWTESRLVKHLKKTSVSHLNVFQVIQDPELENELRQIEQQGFTLILPLRTSKALSGILFVGPKTSGGLFSETDIHLLASFANQAAIALENAIHYESLIKGKKQLEQMFDQKVQAEKMAAIGEMTSILAHELKNPLGIIHSSAQYLVQGQPSKEVTLEMLDYILNEVDHLNLSINSILNLARQKPPQFAAIDLEKEVRKLIVQWEKSDNHNQNVAIQILVPEPLPEVHADFRQLAQVLLNLVRNSEEMLADKGQVDIRLENQNRHIVITIVDNGPGISLENMDHVFDNFFTTKKKGLGLGLAACRQIIHAHDGTISLENIKNNVETGAKATIRIPRQPQGSMENMSRTGVPVTA